MKKLIKSGVFLFTLISFSLVSFYSFKEDPQVCNGKAIEASCGFNPNEYRFLKSRTIHIKSKKDIEKNEYEITLSSGNSYLFKSCSEGGETNMIISLYDKTNNLIMSNFPRGSNKLYKEIEFPCKATNTYTLSFSFQDGQPGCGVGLVCFKPTKSVKKKK